MHTRGPAQLCGHSGQEAFHCEKEGGSALQNSHCVSSSIFFLPLSSCPEAPGMERDNSWPKRPSAVPSISVLLIL